MMRIVVVAVLLLFTWTSDLSAQLLRGRLFGNRCGISRCAPIQNTCPPSCNSCMTSVTLLHLGLMRTENQALLDCLAQCGNHQACRCYCHCRYPAEGVCVPHSTCAQQCGAFPMGYQNIPCFGMTGCCPSDGILFIQKNMVSPCESNCPRVLPRCRLLNRLRGR